MTDFIVYSVKKPQILSFMEVIVCNLFRYLLMAVCCSDCSHLRSPWYCPYCNQTSTRKWNVSTHIKRKHQGRFNPFELMKKIMMTDSYYEPGIQTISSTPNSFWPEIDWSNPWEVMARSTKMKNLLEESRNLSKMELGYLLIAIYNQMQSKWLNSRVQTQFYRLFNFILY